MKKLILCSLFMLLSGSLFAQDNYAASDNVDDVFVSLENYFVAIESKDGLDNKFITEVINDAGYDVQKIEIFPITVNQIRIENE